MTDLGFLDEVHKLPQHDDSVVDWRIFRDPGQARAFAANVQLDKGQEMVGGRAQDSVGTLWWVGVRVDAGYEAQQVQLGRAERRRSVRTPGK